MKVKHLLCGIVVAILILYILKILFHGGNGFSIGGQDEPTCPSKGSSKEESSPVGLDEYLCIGRCDLCNPTECPPKRSTCNPDDGTCSCTDPSRNKGPKCNQCTSSYTNPPDCNCSKLESASQCSIFEKNSTLLFVTMIRPIWVVVYQ